MYTDLLRKTLTETLGALEATEDEFAALNAKREKLRAVAASISAVLNEGKPPVDQLTVSSITIKDGSPKPTWMVVRDAFPRPGETMSVPQLAKIINVNGTIRNPDAIRIAMRRKPEVFEQKPGGVFALRHNGASHETQRATEVAH